MSCLKQVTLVAVLRLMGSLFQLLGPTYDKLYFPSFDLQKVNFSFFTRVRGYTITIDKTENFIKVDRRLIDVKFKNI